VCRARPVAVGKCRWVPLCTEVRRSAPSEQVPGRQYVPVARGSLCGRQKSSTSRLYSANESVTLACRCRHPNALSFHGLGSPPRSLLYRHTSHRSEKSFSRWKTTFLFGLPRAEAQRGPRYPFQGSSGASCQPRQAASVRRTLPASCWAKASRGAPGEPKLPGSRGQAEARAGGTHMSESRGSRSCDGCSKVLQAGPTVHRFLFTEVSRRWTPCKSVR
jgi:hypothetical protein